MRMYTTCTAFSSYRYKQAVRIVHHHPYHSRRGSFTVLRARCSLLRFTVGGKVSHFYDVDSVLGLHADEVFFAFFVTHTLRIFLFCQQCSQNFLLYSFGYHSLPECLLQFLLLQRLDPLLGGVSFLQEKSLRISLRPCRSQKVQVS